METNSLRMKKVNLELFITSNIFSAANIALEEKLIFLLTLESKLDHCTSITTRKNVKFSRHENVWLSVGIAPHILNLGTRWR
jgi:hypothetical protein